FGGPGGSLDDAEVVVVAHSTIALNEANEAKGLNAQAQQHAGKTYYKYTERGAKQPTFFFIPDSNTFVLVMGTTEDLFKAMVAAGGPTVKLSAERRKSLE